MGGFAMERSGKQQSSMGEDGLPSEVFCILWKVLVRQWCMIAGTPRLLGGDVVLAEGHDVSGRV